MKILVTGASGQLGLSIRKITPEWPCHTFIFTDLSELDVANLESLDKYLSANRVDIIINCAAYTDVDRAESEPEIAFRINSDGPANLAAVCARENIRLVHISTDYVFGGDLPRPLRETDPTGPLNVYGKTKLEGEDRIKASGCGAIIIRTSWLYSEFGHNFVKTMLRLGSGKKPVRVVSDQVGTPTYATDLARAIMSFAADALRGQEIYHYSGSGVASWFDFAKAVTEAEEGGAEIIPVNSDQYPAKALRPAYSVLSKEKIKSAGIALPYWRDSLRQCLEELKRQEYAGI